MKEMGSTTLSLIAVIFFISATYGEVCKIGNNSITWPTCPDRYDPPTHRYCCKSNGPVRCCNEMEYLPENEFGVMTTVIIAVLILVVPALCYLTFFCCPGCPCYRWTRSRYPGFVMPTPAIVVVEPSPQYTGSVLNTHTPGK